MTQWRYRSSRKQKNRESLINDDCLLITPLSLETCVSKIEAMAYYDLKVDIHYQSADEVEIHFRQRRDYDYPIYITSRLIATSKGTCLTVDRGSSTPQSYFYTNFDQKTTILSQLMVGLLILLIIVLVFQDPTRALLLIFLVPIFDLLFKLGVLRDPNTLAFETDEMTETMLKRADEFKSELYDVLYAKQSEARFDELGNMYYIEAGDSVDSIENESG